MSVGDSEGLKGHGPVVVVAVVAAPAEGGYKQKC